MKSQHSVDTIVARATAAGVGAIAVVRVSGPLALSLTDALLKKAVGDKPSHSAHLRSMFDADGLMDEALITLFKGGRAIRVKTRWKFRFTAANTLFRVC